MSTHILSTHLFQNTSPLSTGILSDVTGKPARGPKLHVHLINQKPYKWCNNSQYNRTVGAVPKLKESPRAVGISIKAFICRLHGLERQLLNIPRYAIGGYTCVVERERSFQK